MTAVSLRAQGGAEAAIREKMRVDPVLLERLMRSVGSKPVPIAEPEERASSLAEPEQMLISGVKEPESELHAAANPTMPSNLIVSVIRQGNINSDFVGWLTCPVYYTKDFGKTWSKSSFKTVAANAQFTLGGGDPMLCFDADGKAYLSWINYFSVGGSSYTFGLYWAYSTDGGATWTKPKNPVIGEGQVGQAGSEVFDKQWMVVDTTSSQYRNNFYCVFMHGVGQSAEIVVRTKQAGSDAFSTKNVVASTGVDSVQFASIDVGVGGEVHVTFYGYGEEGPALYHAVSRDGAKTFSTPNRISPFHLFRVSADAQGESIIGIRADRIYPCPHLVIDHSDGPTRGTLYQVWTADGITKREENGLDIYLSRSTDQGATWSTPIVVNDDPRGLERHQFYPSITVNAKGRLTVGWYDRRDDPSQVETDYYLASSTDGGQSFQPSFKVTSQPSDFETIGELNSGFGIGEYTQIISSGGYSIPFWADGRKGDGDIDVYAAFVADGSPASVGVVEVADPRERLLLDEPVSSGGGISLGFEIGDASSVRATLHDMSGAERRSVDLGRRDAGRQQATIQTEDLPSGVYLLTLSSEHGRATRRVAILR